MFIDIFIIIFEIKNEFYFCQNIRKFFSFNLFCFSFFSFNLRGLHVKAFLENIDLPFINFQNSPYILFKFFTRFWALLFKHEKFIWSHDIWHFFFDEVINEMNLNKVLVQK